MTMNAFEGWNFINEFAFLFPPSVHFPQQYVVLPTRRSTAEAFQILISHAFGDAGSPYLIGLVCPIFIPIQTDIWIHNWFDRFMFLDFRSHQRIEWWRKKYHWFGWHNYNSGSSSWSGKIFNNLWETLRPLFIQYFNLYSNRKPNSNRCNTHCS